MSRQEEGLMSESHSADTLLQVEDLTTHFFTDIGVARAVDGVSFALRPGRTLALVGESGCGKSVTGLSLLRLVPPPGRIVKGRVFFEGRDLLALPEAEMRRVRGAQIAMIFQEPMTSMNPVFRIGDQIAAHLVYHTGISYTAALGKTEQLLAHVGIADPGLCMRKYPHELSGGMVQRAMIAMALACQPKLLIADEPTTALDVTVQRQILELLQHLQAETGMALLLITHDFGVVAEIAHDVMVMYAGKIVESGPLDVLLTAPKHPYTQGLLAAMPSLHRRGEPLYSIPGTVPPATRFPTGCRFRPRCPHAFDACTQDPPTFRISKNHDAACWLFERTQEVGGNTTASVCKPEDERRA